MKILSSQHIEQKFIFDVRYDEMILDWLFHTCIPDPFYYSGTVSTIYYDTPALQFYDEKNDGNFEKCKVRLRWYSDINGPDRVSEVKCFLELKRKYGSLCKKERIGVLISSDTLNDHPFSDDVILNLPDRVYELGYFPPGYLVPTVLIKYNRYRFVDPQSRSRIAMDTDIRCTHINQSFFPAVAPAFVDNGVLEVKGDRAVKLESLRPIASYLIKSSFSKYAGCLEAMLQPAERSAQ